jgi:hypothetical protein
MSDVADTRPIDNGERPARDAAAALPLDDSRLAMMRRVKRMPLAERIALLDRLCREGTRIASRARRVR